MFYDPEREQKAGHVKIFQEVVLAPFEEDYVWPVVSTAVKASRWKGVSIIIRGGLGDLSGERVAGALERD